MKLSIEIFHLFSTYYASSWCQVLLQLVPWSSQQFLWYILWAPFCIWENWDRREPQGHIVDKGHSGIKILSFTPKFIIVSLLSPKHAIRWSSVVELSFYGKILNFYFPSQLFDACKPTFFIFGFLAISFPFPQGKCTCLKPVAISGLT